jgi:hypothetical protein
MFLVLGLILYRAVIDPLVNKESRDGMKGDK